MLSASEIKRLKNTQILMERATSEGEAAAAAAALTRLLMKHGLEAADINNLTETVANKFTRGNGSLDTGAIWKRELIKLIAANCFTQIIWYTGDSKRFTIIGERSNIETTKELFNTSRHIIEHLAEVGYQGYLRAARAAGQREFLHGREYKTSFYQGAVQGFREAFAEAKKAAESSVKNGSAIAVAISNELDTYKKELFPDLETMKKTKFTINREAYEEGRKKGRTMNTNVAKQLQTV